MTATKAVDKTYHVDRREFLAALRDESRLDRTGNLATIINYVDQTVGEAFRTRFNKAVMTSGLAPQIVHVRKERHPPFAGCNSHRVPRDASGLSNRSDHYIIKVEPGHRKLSSLAEKPLFMPWTYFDVSVQFKPNAALGIYHCVRNYYGLPEAVDYGKPTHHFWFTPIVNAVYFSNEEITEDNYSSAKLVVPWLPNIYMGGAWAPRLDRDKPVPCMPKTSMKFFPKLTRDCTRISNLFEIDDRDVQLMVADLAKAVSNFFFANFNNDNLRRVKTHHRQFLRTVGVYDDIIGQTPNYTRRSIYNMLADKGSEIMDIPISKWAYKKRPASILFEPKNPRRKRGVQEQRRVSRRKESST
jgi:hypothetical protein